MSSQDHSQLEVVSELTAQRDLASLAQALVRGITHFVAGATVNVFALRGELGKLSAEVLGSTDPQLLHTHLTSLDHRSMLRACIERADMVMLHNGRGRQLAHPVLEQGEVVGLVVCETEAGEVPHGLIGQMVRIYTNLHSILNRQQRDGLTGLFNRAALDNWLSNTLARESGKERRAGGMASLGCLAILDIDYFKRINDSLGHLYGDEVLLLLADLMRESFRFNDLLFRYGGEEFVMVLPDTDLASAMQVLDRFRARIASYGFPQINQVTVSIGVACIEPGQLPVTLIDRPNN